MRVSTRMIFDSGVTNLQKQTAATLKLQQQLATNKRMLTPSDDPVAAAQALEVTQAKSLNTLYTTNQSNANDSLALAEGQISSAEDLLQSVQQLTLQLGNAALSDSDRKGIATQLRASFDALQGIANQQDGTGNYLFSGYRGDTKPFTGTADTGVTYNGDDGQRLLRVSPSRDIEISNSGRDVFLNVPDTSKPFAIGADSLNSGTGAISAPTISDANKWNSPLNPKNFSIKFAVVAGVTTYDVVDNNGTSILTNSAASNTPPLPGTYVNGATIDIKSLSPGIDYGASVVIKGSPANGDTFTLKPTSPVSVFDTISGVIQAAEQTLSGASTTKLDDFRTQINTAIANLSSSQDNFLRVRTSIGSRMSELDALQTSSSQRSLDYDTTLSRLQDVDQISAISDLNRTQISLQAAQMSFTKISQLSLFNYL